MCLLYRQTLISPILSGFSQSNNNYANGNGTIIEIKMDGNIKWIFRKHIQQIQIGDLSRNENLIIYNRPVIENGVIVGRLKLNDNINIIQLAEAIIANGDYYYWLKITTDDRVNGWIFCGKYQNKEQYDERYWVPYFNGRWEIIEKINIGGKNWTVRKISQTITVWEVLNIRDKPGLADTKVISKIVPPENENPQVNLAITEATEETETIDGLTDRWLKINYHGVNGWIFGGYTTVERGGYKYYTPENNILSKLGWF